MDKFHITVLCPKGKDIQEDIKSIATSVSYEDYDVEKLLEPFDPCPDVILCYPADGEISPLEIAQTIRSNYPEKPVFFIASDKKDFDKKKLVKNGFSQAYLLPWEKTDLLRKIREVNFYSRKPELRDYKAVRVVDLIPGTILSFSLRILLPLNDKFILFSQEGMPIEQDKLSKLNENSLNTLYVHKDDVVKFRQYTAEMFKRNLRDTEMSETEKQENLESCIRELISDMFIQDAKENTFGKSQSLLQEVKEVIKLLINEGHKDLMSKLELLVNQESSFYLHLSNVSTYAGIFAIALKFEKPEELALAGILHDIGKINLPKELAEVKDEDLRSQNTEVFKSHAQFSLDIIKLKRIALSDRVIKAIIQHHEAINGSGYPKGLEGHRISREGRLLAIANEFDHLTSSRDKKKNLSPRDALLHMFDVNAKDPGRMKLDIEMLRDLKTYFINEKGNNE